MTSVSDRTRRRLPTALAGLGVIACVACCALPLLLAAGALSGAGWAITSLAWGMVADGFRPDRWDVTGALICLAGVAVIMYAPRASSV